MCGIVGYTGNKPAVKILLDGLKRLEYRGYDSAGLTLGGKELKTVKAVGKVRNLEQETLACGELTSTTGIAHTRWATHGIPSVRNAHPHVDNSGKIAVVHNGIIENYAELKQKLIAEGYTFASDTDTEVVANLISEFEAVDRRHLNVGNDEVVLALVQGFESLLGVPDFR